MPTIPEGDEDLITREEKDVPHLFRKYKTNAGEVVTLYPNDRLVQQYNARQALPLSTGEFPKMSKEEILEQQKKLMDEYSKKKDTLGARRGRGR